MIEVRKIGWSIVFQCLALFSYAQSSHTNWYFGDGCLMSFDSNSVSLSNVQSCVSVDGTGTKFIEGTSSIDDENGNLLFHGHGGKLYHRNTKLVYDRSALSAASSIQSLILVDLNNHSKQYLAIQSTSSEQIRKDSNAQVHYVVLDSEGTINRSGTFGLKNFENNAMTISADSSGYWLAAVDRVGNETVNLRSYLFDSTARIIDSTILVLDGRRNGRRNYNKFSPNGELFGGQRVHALGETGVLVCKFSNETGVFTNPLIIPTNDRAEPYKQGFEFSPNSKFCYLIKASDDVDLLVQYDLSSWDPQIILESEKIIDTIHRDNYQDMVAGIQLGPDGRIYLFHRSSRFISRISYPNRSGSACEYIENEIELQGSMNLFGGPYYPTYSFRVWDSLPLRKEYTICSNEVLILDIDTAVFEKVKWSTGEIGGSLTINLPGKYSVEVMNKWGIERTFNFEVRYIENCESTIYVPNAFSPNGDFKNDFFGPVTSNMKDVKTDIYDRWGALIYTSFDQAQKWDGTYNGVACQEGVYIYKIVAITNDQRIVTTSGTITLLR